MKQKIYLDTLPEGYCLHWYELKSVIGRGGYGITYLALDKNLDRMVAIKEYLPTDFASRESDDTVKPITGEKGEIFNWGLDRFLKEARTLAKFTHPNIVRVLSVFEQNNTAYMVMEYEHGSNLAKLYKNSPHYSEQQLLDVFIPILDGLALVHDAGFIHRDIKPANIYIRENNTPVLLDFGSARRTSGSLTHALTSLVTFGYAPFEQYNESGGKQGPWTDIYSLGATMYLGITGKLPIDAMSRGGSYINNEADPYEPISEKAAGKCTPEFLLAIDNALFFRAEERPQDSLSWKDMLLGQIPANPLPANMLVSSEEENDDDQTIIMPRGNKGQPVTGGHSERHSSRVTTHDETLVSSNNIYQKPLSERTTPPSSSTSPPSYRTTPPKNLWKDESIYQQDQKKDITSTLQNTLDQILRHQYFPWAIGGVAILLVALVVIVSVSPGSDPGVSPTQTSGAKTERLEPTVAPVKEREPIPAEPKPMNEPVAVDEKSLEILKLLEQADADFIAGRIIQPQGKSAVYHYLRVLDLDPDNELAKTGIDKVLTFFASATKSFLNAGDVKEAEKNLKIMEAISLNSSITAQTRNQFDSVNKNSAEVTSLLEQAQRYVKENKLTKPDGKNAYELFKKVLELDSSNKIALDGIAKIASYYNSRTLKYIKSNNVQMAQVSLNRLKKISPDSKNIPKFEAQVAELLKLDKKVKSWLTKAQISFANEKMSKPKKDSALFWYKRVLDVQPKNKKALIGIENILNYYQKRFYLHLDGNKVSRAKRVLKTVYSIAPKSQTYKKMKAQLSKSSKAKQKGRTPQIEAISELIGKYKYALEAHDAKKIKGLSAVSPSRENFMKQLFGQYKKFKVNVSGVKFIGKENRATAEVSIVDLINKKGEPVSPGQWSKFDIVIRRNVENHWTIFW